MLGFYRLILGWGDMDVCSIAIIAKRTGLFPGPGSYELLENCSIDEYSDGGSMPAGRVRVPVLLMRSASEKNTKTWVWVRLGLRTSVSG